MAITFNETTRIFTLTTAHTTYQMQADAQGYLLHLYYGARTAGEMDYLLNYGDRGFSGNPNSAGSDRTYSLDALPQEYPSLGTGDFRNYALNIENADGSQCCNPVYITHEIAAGKYTLKGLPFVRAEENEAETLKIILEDPVTKVELHLLYGVLEKEDIINKIKEEFFWFLELNKENDYKIIVDKECINYSDFVEHTENMDVSKYGCKETYDVRFVQWKQKLGNEYSRIYYLGSDNKERYKETTKLNKRADHFFHSVYIKSSYFDDFHFTNEEIEGQGDLFPNKCDDEYKILINGINTFLIKYRSRYLKEASDAYISKLIDDKLYPEFDTTNFIQAYQKKELDSLVGALYAAQPKIFTGLSNDNKKITLQLLRLIMDNGNKPELFKILQGVIELDEEERKELSSILEYSSLSNITKTIKLLCDRQKVIQALKEIVFNKEFNSYEVTHVQELVENHYWIFGEQYNLITSAEPDFELALKGMIKAETGMEEEIHIAS